MVIKFQEFQAPPKRKYVRKTKTQNDMDIMNTLDQEIQEKKSEEDIQLNQSIKKLKISEDIKPNKTILPVTLPTPTPTLNSTSNIMDIIPIDSYEFINPYHIYLYYIVEQLGKNTQKYQYYTSTYQHISGCILLSSNKPRDFKSKSHQIEKVEEEEIKLYPNLFLHIKRFYCKKHNYTYEECNENLNRKRKIEEDDYDWNYDFCQIKIKGLCNEDVNKYVFIHENKCFLVPYKIKITFPEVKLLTNKSE